MKHIDASRINPLKYLFSMTWTYSAGNRHKVVLYWSLFIMSASIDIFAIPFVWATIMKVIQISGVTHDSFRTLMLLLGTSLVCHLVSWVFHGPARVIERVNAFQCRANYRKSLLSGILGLPMEWHVDHHSGDTIDKVEKGTNALFSFSEDSYEIIYTFAKLIGSFAVLVYFSPSASYIVLGMLLVSIWITMRFDKVLIGQYKELSRSENIISENVFDTISNISTVVTLRVEKLVFEGMVNKIMKPFGLFRRNAELIEWKWCLVSMCCSIMTWLVLGMYFWKHFGAAQGILVGNVYLLIQYLDKASDVFFQFTGRYSETMKHKARLMNSEELSIDFKPGSLVNHVLPAKWQSIQVSDLHFTYNGDKQVRHLDNVSLSIRRGERIAFVGESGGGKTTLLRIIRDLYHPQKIQLTVDGIEIKDGFGGISRAIALVPQNPEIFARTILENITLGADYSMSDVERYVQMACFTNVVAGLPKGYQSSLKEKGVNLSGGEQQRLALARGLLASKGKDILLLDEPTSSVDSINELEIYQNILQGLQDTTIISTIHGLHLLPLFDRICVFDDGKIVGDGTLRDLLTSCPTFQILWNKRQNVKKIVE